MSHFSLLDSSSTSNIFLYVDPQNKICQSTFVSEEDFLSHSSTKANEIAIQIFSDIESFFNSKREDKKLIAINFGNLTFNEEVFNKLLNTIQKCSTIKLLCFNYNNLSESQRNQLLMVINSNDKKGMRILNPDGSKFGTVISNWDSYYEAKRKETSDSNKYLGGLNFIVDHALFLYQNEHGQLPGKSIDFGCGEGRDSINLLQEGCKQIIAIDGDDNAINNLKKNIPAGKESCIAVITAPFMTTEIDGQADLFIASYAWPYRPPTDFMPCWEKCVSLVKSGGYICGEFFGPKEKNDPYMTYHTEKQVRELLEKDFTILIFEIKDTKVIGGDDAPWGELYHIVAKKK